MHESLLSILTVTLGSTVTTTHHLISHSNKLTPQNSSGNTSMLRDSHMECNESPNECSEKVGQGNY